MIDQSTCVYMFIYAFAFHCANAKDWHASWWQYFLWFFILAGNYDDYDDERVVVRFAWPPFANCNPSRAPTLSSATASTVSGNRGLSTWQQRRRRPRWRNVAIPRNFLCSQAIVCVSWAAFTNSAAQRLAGGCAACKSLYALANRVSKN